LPAKLHLRILTLVRIDTGNGQNHVAVFAIGLGDLLVWNAAAMVLRFTVNLTSSIGLIQS
jgi:hypothetical protein